MQGHAYGRKHHDVAPTDLVPLIESPPGLEHRGCDSLLPECTTAASINKPNLLSYAGTHATSLCMYRHLDKLRRTGICLVPLFGAFVVAFVVPDAQGGALLIIGMRADA